MKKGLKKISQMQKKQKKDDKKGMMKTHVNVSQENTQKGSS